MIRKLLTLLLISFALNFLWEHLHAPLYAHYKGGSITNAILLHATLADALFITALGWLFFAVEPLRRRPWLMIVFGIALAIGIERWALGTGRWAYTALMPVIPFIRTGLTPTIQLGLTGYITWRLSDAILCAWTGDS